MGLKEKIKSNSKLKKLVHWSILIPKQTRPRLWIKWFVNPFYHKKGKGAIVRPRTRMDVVPWNKFNLGEGATLVDDYMIPPQKSVALAWYWVNEIIKVNQNIERTHPNRMDIGTFERKFNRISKRNKQK